MSTLSITHPFTFLSKAEAKDPIRTLIECDEDFDLYADRKCTIAAFSHYSAQTEEEADSLSKTDQIDLSQRQIKMREAAAVLRDMVSKGLFTYKYHIPEPTDRSAP